jgi:putative oxidoreductase
MTARSSAQDVVYTGLRLVASWVYVQHGLQKMFGLFGGFGPGGATAPMGTIFFVAGVIECICGTLIFLGLFTRPLAFIASGEMAVAYFMAHAPTNPVVTALNHGETPALLCFAFLYISLTGPGPYSLDALMLGKKAAPMDRAPGSA